MSGPSIGEFVRQLRPVASSVTDAALLADFCAQRDSAALTELLRRYGSMVLGVCRRILVNSHDAEDAFQAVFLVLVRKANTIRPPGTVGSWLYGVALRIARKSRTAAARRCRREMAKALAGADCTITGPDRLELDETRRIIDDEIGKLPDRLRSPLLLCDLRGRSRADAARQLECPEGTVAARLARAREVLAAGLIRRGITLPAAGLSAVLLPEGVSAALAETMSAAARAFAIDSASTAVGHTIRTLAEGALWSMRIKQITWLAGGLLAIAIAAGGTALMLRPDAPVNAAAAQSAQPINPPVAKRKAEAEWKERAVLKQPGWLAGSVAYTVDGKMLVVGGIGGHVQAYETKGLTSAWEYANDDGFAAVACSPDDSSLATTCKDGIQFLDAKTGKAADKVTQEGITPIAVGFFPSVIRGKAKSMRQVIFGDAHKYVVRTGVSWDEASTISLTVRADDKPVADPYAVPLAVAPDLKHGVVVTGPIDRDTGKNVLWVWSAGSGVGNELLAGHKAVVTAAAWSNDGGTIITGDADGVIICWDSPTFKEKARMNLGARVAAVAVSADGKRVAAAVTRRDARKDVDEYSQEVCVWSADQWANKPAPLFRRAAGGTFNGIASISFSPDGQELAAAFCCFADLKRIADIAGRVSIWHLVQK